MKTCILKGFDCGKGCRSGGHGVGSAKSGARRSAARPLRIAACRGGRRAQSPSRRGARAHLGRNKGRTHLRRRRGLGRAAGAYLGLRGSLRGSVCRAGHSQDGTIGGREQADESRRRSAGTASRSGQAGAAAAAAAAGGGRGRPEAGALAGPGQRSQPRASRGAAQVRAGPTRRQWRRRVGLTQAPLVAMETSCSRSRARPRRRPRPGSSVRRPAPMPRSPASRGHPPRVLP